jgi:hypothetical protein
MRNWVLAAAIWMALAGGASAQPQSQQQPPDPFGGRFGVFEIAPMPTDAAQQHQLLATALASVAPQRAGRQDVYILSMALWGDPVFTREATQAEAILRQHFGSEGRSVTLAASPAGPRTLPVATPNNIAAAIGHLGSVIDANEDLVVVFLTTHGGPDGTAAIREHGRMFGGLRPQHLAAMLNQAGIRNRVVIVSSCFSGAFIPPLANDNTIVMTAAQHDRSSFGCQPENDWTFFGDALFNTSLRNGQSLIEGFDSAKVLIERWERERGLTPPSNPQRSVGRVAEQMVRSAERSRR